MVEPGVIPITSCTQIQEDALALLSSELSDEQERQVFIHLATCPRCREEFRKDRMMMRMLSACPTIAAGAGFDEELAKRLLDDSSSPDATRMHGIKESSNTIPNPAGETPKRSSSKQDRKKPK